MLEVVFYQPLRRLANGLLGGLADRLAGSQRLLLPYLVAGWGRAASELGKGGEAVLCLHAGSWGRCARVPWSKHRSLKDSKGAGESSLQSRQPGGSGLIPQERRWWTACVWARECERHRENGGLRWKVPKKGVSAGSFQPSLPRPGLLSGQLRRAAKGN